jgi:YrbI family 3-deoxy-D-manno-octulosonate 8-phosphate phosphatase
MGVRTAAVIPARGGSKGVPGKNLMRVGGRSLVARAVDACRAAASIDAVYVSTDDPEIARAAADAGAGVISRPAALATDEASSEAALEHSLGYLDWVGVQPDVLVFVQCTSPFIDPAALDRGVGLITDGRADSAFAGVETYEFLWRAVAGPGAAEVVGQNHDRAVRPRRQDRAPDFRETGAFYVMSVSGFRAEKHRFFGRTAVVPVSPLTAVEIDTVDDVAVAAALAPMLDPRPVVDVDAVITDFDGVHTDDTVHVTQDGLESVQVSRSDGLGVERLRRAGIPLLIVSKETNPVVRARAAKLGAEVLHGIEHKTEVVRDWLRCREVPPERAAYLGNDLNDLGPMSLVGWPIAVADARAEVRHAARLVLTRAGGHGAVRELCDHVLRSGAARSALPPTATAPGAAAGPPSVRLSGTAAAADPGSGLAELASPTAGSPPEWATAPPDAG